MRNKIRILLVDDHAIIRKGLRGYIDTEPGMGIVGEASDGLEAIRMAAALKPDVVVLDLVMPRMGGLEALPDILKSSPESKILVLTSFGRDDLMIQAVRAGAIGFLLKDVSPEDLMDAIRKVAHGEAYIHPALAGRLIVGMSQPHVPEKMPDRLTDREREVLRCVAQGMSNSQIATQLVISQSTVHSHIRKILKKLGAENRTQATHLARREGLLD